MDAIIHHGPISRAQIAKRTQISKQTASEVVRELEEAGWVRVHGQTQGLVGRTAVTYEIRPEAAYVTGVDLGGTQLRMAIANLACAVVAEASETTSESGGEAVVEQIIALSNRLSEQAGLNRDKIRLIVVGTPGVVDPVTGAIRFAPNIPGFDQFDVIGALRKGFGVDVIIENDVNVAAVGERWLGKARGADSFAYVALGTGLGMGVVSAGELIRGAHGAAGEIGALPIGGDAFDPANRLHGTLETAVGSAGILQRYAERGGAPGRTVRDLFDAIPTDQTAQRVIEETGRLLALAALSIAAMFDPEIIVFGGSIGSRPELIEIVRRRLASCMTSPVPVEAGALGNRAGIVGALAIGINNIHNALFAPSFSPGVLSLPAINEIRGPEIAA